MDYFTEFQSHSKEFDPLRSMEIEETITGLSWLNPQGKYLKIVSTNNRNIKLWKIFEKTERKVIKSATKDLNIPKLQSADSSYTANLQLCLPPKHLSSINSISGSKNEEYLLSTDEVQALYWNY
jgi:serine/threonine-protein phosphatase 2A regulatory subunit B